MIFANVRLNRIINIEKADFNLKSAFLLLGYTYQIRTFEGFYDYVFFCNAFVLNDPDLQK